MMSLVLLISFVAIAVIGILLIYNGFANKWSQKYLWAVMGLCIIALAASAYVDTNTGTSEKPGSKAAEKQIVNDKDASGNNSAASEEASDAVTAEKIEKDNGTSTTADDSNTNTKDSAKQTPTTSPSAKTPVSESQSATNKAPYNQTPSDVTATTEPPAPPSNSDTNDQTSGQTDTGSSSTPTDDQTNTQQPSSSPPAPPPPPAPPQ